MNAGYCFTPRVCGCDPTRAVRISQGQIKQPYRMRSLLVCIFLLFLSTAHAQWQDDFSDGEFLDQPAWTGDTADFTVNSDRRLQLDAAVAGTSHLSMAVPLPSLDRMEWRFRIRLDFSPSSANYSRFYLVSDAQDLEGSLHGYYLQFGEALANDAVELFRQDGTTSVSIVRGPDGMVANAFTLGVRVSRDETGVWSIFLDTAGGTDYLFAALGAESLYTSSAYTGWRCVYTSGNRDGFELDDVMILPLQVDSVAPRFVQLATESDRSLRLLFDETIEPGSAANTIHYRLDPGAILPLTAQRDALDTKAILLEFANAFQAGQTYSLTVSGLADAAGNTVRDTTLNFVYAPPVPVLAGDAVFNEIYFEPTASAGLPYAEYVELYNRSDHALSLQDWSLSDGSATAIFPEMTIAAGAYLLVTDEDAIGLLSAFGPAVGLQDFPGLNNDVGDRLVLRDRDGQVVDAVTFSNDTYHDGSRDDGGWSLERIDPDFLCENEDNWRASYDLSGGTPGEANVVRNVFQDTRRPFLKNAEWIDGLTTRLWFSEPMDTASMTYPDRYTLHRHDETTLSAATVQADVEGRYADLRWPSPVDTGLSWISVSGLLLDCPGNAAYQDQRVPLGIGMPPVSGDVVINEVLFDAPDDASDFVELYNGSEKLLDLKDWTIAEVSAMEPYVVQSVKKLTNENLLLAPGGYLVLTETPLELQRHYPYYDRFCFLDVDDLPDFNSTEGGILLASAGGDTLDFLVYSDDWHYPLLSITKGVSLERMRVTGPTQSADNWHSAAATIGYASPGLLNSQALADQTGVGELLLEPEVFSPDNDGKDDVLQIHLQFPDAGRRATVAIFDPHGNEVARPLEYSLAGTDHVLTWNGVGANGRLVAEGVYIVWTESFDLDGHVSRLKKAVVVLRKG